jgi:hypothetical protein
MHKDAMMGLQREKAMEQEIDLLNARDVAWSQRVKQLEEEIEELKVKLNKTTNA